MSIEVDHLSKFYGDVPVVDDVSLGVASRELFVLLGPSGSGKSTLLRLIAGLAAVDQGTIRLHGKDVTRVSPKDRGIGFVFQHYGLFRHMSVADNVEFALRVRKVDARTRRERREELLQLVGLSGFAKRRPHQLSGGQQQRVALARALAHEPRVLLLDEPFGALDAKIRSELRQSLRRIQRELGITTVFVTHDQEEAFELADRLAILRNGRLLEVGEPQELYLRPRSPFVATFLGAANLFVAQSTLTSVKMGEVELPVEPEVTSGRTPRRTQVLFRPEDVEILNGGGENEPRALGRGVVEEHLVIGGFERLRLRISSLAGVRAVSPPVPFGGDHLLVDALRPEHEAERLPLTVGDRAWVGIRRFHVLAPANLRLLLDSGTSAPARAARELGNQIASRIDANRTVLASANSLQDEGGDPVALGAETEDPAEGFDVAVLGLEPEVLHQRNEWLAHVHHHLLLVPRAVEIPTRFLLCVEVGELGKADVRFAERFAWQLGAAATILTVLPEHVRERGIEPHVQRFMDAAVRSMGCRGVVTRSLFRFGHALEQILLAIEEGQHDLVVVGAPLSPSAWRRAGIVGLADRLVRHALPLPILVVRR